MLIGINRGRLIFEDCFEQMSYISSEDTPPGTKKESVAKNYTTSHDYLPYDRRKADQITKNSVNPTYTSPSGLQSVDPNSKSKASMSEPQNMDPVIKGTTDSSTNHHSFPSPLVPANSELPTTTGMPTVVGATNSKTSDTKIINSLTNHGQGSGNSSRSDSLESSSAPLKPHTGGDVRWDAINMVSKGSALNLSHFRLLKRLGYGDIGSVYLVELRGTKAYFAMKVMDKASLASRNKLLRAQTEREILGLLDHPFLPTLYSYFETDKFCCIVMEFCSGGNLHSLRQKQPNKHFTEEAAR